MKVVLEALLMHYYSIILGIRDTVRRATASHDLLLLMLR